MTTQTVTIERYKIELALEALENPDGLDEYNRSISNNAITAIKEVLQSNEQGQKPVEFDVKCDACKGNGLDAADNNYFCSVCAGSGFVEKMFYPDPPKLKPLTIGQIASIAIDRSKPDGIIAFVRAIEAAHNIHPTGFKE